MYIIEGKYNKAKIFCDAVEKTAEEQIRAMCDFSAFRGRKIRIMPDVHAGAGCTIGTTMDIKDKIVPNMVGVDIGCGMEVLELNDREIDFEKLDRLIRENIPSGMTCRKEKHAYAERIDLTALRIAPFVRLSLAQRSVGTLGGGNHFIEIDADEEGRKYLVIHSGSRHLGLEVAQYYQKAAYDVLCEKEKGERDSLVSRLKAEGKRNKISSELKKTEKKETVPPDMAYVTGSLFDDYIHDMEIVQRFASLNRQAMADEIVRGMGFSVSDTFTTVHNYIDTEKMILRKGAVSARKGERLLIPVNMRDGSLICKGKGNRDWNESAPHGAGRLLSRGAAFRSLTVEEFEREMTGIYTTCVGKSTLDESPMAYKKMEDIVDNIAPTVEIEKRILPVYNFKAAEDFGRRRRK